MEKRSSEITEVLNFYGFFEILRGAFITINIQIRLVVLEHSGISNYKCHTNTLVTLSSFHTIIGANSSGKNKYYRIPSCFILFVLCLFLQVSMSYHYLCFCIHLKQYHFVPFVDLLLYIFRHSVPMQTSMLF